MKKNKYNSDENNDQVRDAMNSDIMKFPVTEKDIPNSTNLSVVYETPLARKPSVKDIYNRNYSTQTGTPLSHPLQLMTVIMQECPWADLAVKTIASSCAGTDPLFQLYSKANGRNKSKASNKKMDRLQYLLFEEPNPHQTGDELFLTTYENIATYGNAYWQIIRTKKGDIHSIYSLPPETIRVIPYFDKDDILHNAYYQYDNLYANKGSVFLEHEIVHFKETNEKSFLYGKPRLYALFGHITANAQALTAINSWFEKGWAASAIFKQDADEAVAARNREFLKENYAGADNYGKILLMEGSISLIDSGQKYTGNISFEKMSAVGRDTTLNCMGVPVSVAGVRSDAGQGNAEVIASEEKAFKRNTVDRMHKLVFSKIRQKLIRQMMDDKDIEIQPGALGKFNLSSECALIESMARIGITVGEAREIAGMRTLESDIINNTLVSITNNGIAKFQDLVGFDESGNKVETLWEKNYELQKMQAEANVKVKSDSAKTGPTTISATNEDGKLK